MEAGEDRPSLRDLACELTGIADRISEIADYRDLPTNSGEVGTAQVRALVRARHEREAAVRPGLVHPGWTLLLVLYRAHLDGQPVRMARLATEAHVAMTTMMRWVEFFLAHGLAERRPDPKHRRGVLIMLSAEGAERVRRQVNAEALGGPGPAA